MCVFQVRREGAKDSKLDLIRVCCIQCISRFEVLPEGEQLILLQRAVVNAYGETTFIYAFAIR